MTQLLLRDARKQRKLTQDELAAKSGVDQTMISSIEIGRRKPSDDIKARLATALRIAPSKLQFPSPEPSQSVAEGADRSGHGRSARRAAAGV